MGAACGCRGCWGVEAGCWGIGSVTIGATTGFAGLSGWGAVMLAEHSGHGPVTPAIWAGTLSCVLQFGQWKVIISFACINLEVEIIRPIRVEILSNFLALSIRALVMREFTLQSTIADFSPNKFTKHNRTGMWTRVTCRNRC